MPDVDGIKEAKMFHCDTLRGPRIFPQRLKLFGLGNEKQAGKDIQSGLRPHRYAGH